MEQSMYFMDFQVAEQLNIRQAGSSTCTGIRELLKGKCLNVVKNYMKTENITNLRIKQHIKLKYLSSLTVKSTKKKKERGRKNIHLFRKDRRNTDEDRIHLK